MVESLFFRRHGNVVLYIPNLIGYVRIACALSAFALAPTHPVACFILYLIGFVCDELDGRAARTFEQSSTLGAVLDMLTDRLSTTGLLVLLCMRFQAWYMLFLSLIILDIFSHWLQMYSSLVAGDISHKVTHNQSWLVRYYYTHRIFMGFCCVCCEVLYLALYLLGWEKFWDSPAYSAAFPTRLAVLTGHSRQDEWPVVLIVALASLPGFAIKQMINIAQIKAACSSLIILDQTKDAAKKNRTQ